VQKKVLKNKDLMELVTDTLNQNQIAIIKVKGFSMEPFFKDEITDVSLKKVDTKLKKFDIILFTHQNKYFLHRIIKIKNDLITASGDNLLSKETIQKDQVIGRVISYTKNKKEIMINKFSYMIMSRLYLTLKPLIIRLRNIKNG